MQKLTFSQIIAAAMVIANKLLHPGRVDTERVPEHELQAKAQSKRNKMPAGFWADRSNLIYVEWHEVS